MAWVTPIIHSVGDILTASDWNISSNDLSFLGGLASAVIGTGQGTASSSYVDLATVGPSVTLTTGANAVVMLQANGSNSAGGSGQAWMGFAVSGATTIAPNQIAAVQFANGSAGLALQLGGSFGQGLTAGVNTFTAKYLAQNGGTANFANRYISVLPMP